MALAANSLAYLPPRNIMQMEEDLALLPLWWCEEGDFILTVSNELWQVRAGNSLEMIAKDCDGTYKSHIGDGVKPLPWGWSHAICHKLIGAGVSPHLLPSESDIETYRLLSSRAFACEYISRFLEDADAEGWGYSLVGRQMHVIREFCPSEHVDTKGFPLDGSSHIYKTLWSSSGRGVFTCLPDAPLDVNRVLGAIRHQGGIVEDSFYGNKLLDFALEFEVGEGSAVSYLGLSVFSASTSGAYGYNFVESQESLRNRILSSGVSSQLLDKVITKTQNLLSALIAGRYCGPVGVDMLVCHHGGTVKLHPCIEINLRRNMGILAIDLYDRLGNNTNALLAGRKDKGFSAQVCDGKLSIVYSRGT